MPRFEEKLYIYLYTTCCPNSVGLIDYTKKEGCTGYEPDLQLCRNCWQSAILNLDK